MTELTFDEFNNVLNIMATSGGYYDPTASSGISLAAYLALKRQGQSTGPRKSVNVAEFINFAPTSPHGSEKLKSQLQELKIQRIKGGEGYELPPLVNVDATSIKLKKVYDLVQLVDPTIQAFPFPDFSGKFVVPFYTPKYTLLTNKHIEQYRAGIDKFAVRTVSDVSKALTNENVKMKVKTFYSRLMEIVNTHYYGNGCQLGQLNRYLAVKSVADRLAASRVNKDFNSLLENPNKNDFITNQWPNAAFAGHGDQGYFDLSASFDAQSSFTTDQNGKLVVPPAYSLLRVNLDAGAGPIWRDLTRKDTLVQDLILAKRFMKIAVENARNPEQTLTPYKIVKMKPKAEVYKRSDFEKKTRNYFEYDAFVMLPASIYLTALNTNLKSWTRSEKLDTNHIVGYGLLDGGMQPLIEQFLSGDNTWYKVFSDNLYVKAKCEGKYYWVSMDGEKMEGCVSYEDAKVFMHLLLRNESVNLSDDWHAYLSKVVPYLCTEVRGLIQQVQLRIPGQASGNIFTGMFNTLKMLSCAYEMAKKGFTLEKQGEEFILSKEMKTIADAEGVSLTVESVVPVEDFAKPHALLKTDLLGFNCAVMPLGQILYVPVLDEDRLYKAYAFAKSPTPEGAPPAASLAISLSKIRSLMIMGGWYYSGFATVGWFRQLDLLKALAENVVYKDDFIDTYTNMVDEFVSGKVDLPFMEMTEALKLVLTSTGPVSQAAIWRVILGETLFKAALPSLQKSFGKDLSLFMTPDEYKEFFPEAEQPELLEDNYAEKMKIYLSADVRMRHLRENREQSQLDKLSRALTRAQGVLTAMPVAHPLEIVRKQEELHNVNVTPVTGLDVHPLKGRGGFPAWVPNWLKINIGVKIMEPLLVLFGVNKIQTNAMLIQETDNPDGMFSGVRNRKYRMFQIVLYRICTMVPFLSFEVIRDYIFGPKSDFDLDRIDGFFDPSGSGRKTTFYAQSIKQMLPKLTELWEEIGPFLMMKEYSYAYPQDFANDLATTTTFRNPTTGQLMDAAARQRLLATLALMRINIVSRNAPPFALNGSSPVHNTVVSVADIVAAKKQAPAPVFEKPSFGMDSRRSHQKPAEMRDAKDAHNRSMRKAADQALRAKRDAKFMQ